MSSTKLGGDGTGIASKYVPGWRAKSAGGIGNFLAALCGLGILALSAQVLAQELPGQEPARRGELLRLAQDDTTAADEEKAKEEEAREEEEEEPRSRSATPQKFIPTEKISADSAVSFPVDI